MSILYETEITIPITVLYDYNPGYKAHREPCGFQEEPDDPPETEIVKIIYNEHTIELTKEHSEIVEQEIHDHERNN